MLDRVAVGRFPNVAHTAMRDDHGALHFEHCVTRDGFEGAYSILYHLHPPHAQARAEATRLDTPSSSGTAEAAPPLEKRHFLTSRIEARGDPITSSRLLFTSASIDVSLLTPTESDAAYLIE